MRTKIFILLIHLFALGIRADVKEELLDSVRDTNIPKLKSLLKTKINLEVTDSREMSPLMIAASDNNLEVVQILVEGGADINFKNKEVGKTALMYASSHGHYDVAKFLVSQKRLLIDAKDKEGKTALMYAAQRGRRDVVTLLVESKANVNARTNTDDSALSIALKTGKTEIIALLKKSGARE
jgi:ankyrin repeat protein